MRKQKRESFLVMSMILFNDNNNIHSKEKKKDNDTKAHQIYTRKKNLRRIALSANVASRNIALPLPPHENNIDFILHVNTFDAFCMEGNKTDQRK